MSSVLRQRKQGVVVVSLFCICFTFYVFISLVTKLSSSCEQITEEVQLFSIRGLSAFQNYSQRAKNGLNAAKKSKTKLEFLTDNLNMNQFNDTHYFGCEDFDKLPRSGQSVKENMQGNRGITFMKVSIGGKVVDVVYKTASHFFHTIGDDYKYSSAKREIEFLTKLRGLPGIPHLFGSCVKEDYISYFVERIKGHTLCHDNGTTPRCSKGVDIMRYIRESTDPKLSALKIAFTTTRLFKLLEERHLFLEDISGINLMLSFDFEVFLVDADSLMFYNKNRIFSKLRCETDDDCLGPFGNLWNQNSLNLKIYETCVDLKGMCRSKECRGFDNSLHACGLAEWYLCRLVDFFQDRPDIFKKFESVCLCLRHPSPEDRCTFSFATTQLEDLMNTYIESKQG